MKRVFAAIDISEEVREEVCTYIATLRSEFEQVPVKWEKPEKLHITVKFAGSVDDGQLKAFNEQIQAVASTLAPFQLKIVGSGAFVKRRGPSVLWLGADVVSPSEDPFSALSQLSESESKRPFRTHLTIARLKDPRKAGNLIGQHRSSEFGSALFQVGELAIYESTLLPTGSIYTKLASVRFGKD